MLSTLRRIPAFDRALRDHATWGFSPEIQGELGEIGGRTVGLVGYGAVPRLLAPVLSALGARVLYTARGPRADAVGEWRDLSSLLAEADIVSLHLPLTPETTNLIDAGALASMRPGAVLINTARGGLVDQAALVAALKSGRLRATGLDVFALEPVAEDNPLLRLENVVVLPHVAWFTMETVERSLGVAVENCPAPGLRRAAAQPDCLRQPRGSGLAARRSELIGAARGDQGDVRGRGNVPEALADPPRGAGSIRGDDRRDNAGALARDNDLANGLGMLIGLGRRPIRRGMQAHAQGEVRRADENRVHAGSRRDLVDIGESLRGLHLDHADDLTEIDRVERLHRDHRADGAHRPVAVRRVAARPSRAQRLGPQFHHRDDNRQGSEVERATDQRGVVGRDAARRRSSRGLDGLEEVRQVPEFDEAVLEIRADLVVARGAEVLPDERLAGGQPC